jgi:hypothetical protein
MHRTHSCTDKLLDLSTTCHRRWSERNRNGTVSAPYLPLGAPSRRLDVTHDDTRAIQFTMGLNPVRWYVIRWYEREERSLRVTRSTETASAIATERVATGGPWKPNTAARWIEEYQRRGQ